LARALGCKKKAESGFDRFRKKFRKEQKNDDNTNEDWQGPPLGLNMLLLPVEIKVVKHVAMGEGHLIALVTNQLNENALWGMGTTKWGQLGQDPQQELFFEQLIELDITAANKEEHVPI
jgi:hypothetical protein